MCQVEGKFNIVEQNSNENLKINIGNVYDWMEKVRIKQTWHLVIPDGADYL